MPLILYYVKKFLLGSTPRKMWHIENDMASVAWGTLFPVVSLISVIAIGYMVIAPIVVGFALVTFCLYWLLYRYNFTYVYDMKPENETSGLFFPKAIQQLFAALYLEMVMLTALFFLANVPDGQGGTTQTAVGEGAVMVVLIILVAVFHYFLNDSYKALYDSLPLSLVPTAAAPAGAHGTTSIGSSSDDDDGQRTRTEQDKQLGYAPQGGAAVTPGDTEKGRYETSKALETSFVPQDFKGAAHAYGAKPVDTSDRQLMAAFYHPSLREEQRTLWFPHDKYGMGDAAVLLAQRQKLDATNEKTTYNDKDRVVPLARVPPGEELT